MGKNKKKQEKGKRFKENEEKNEQTEQAEQPSEPEQQLEQSSESEKQPEQLSESKQKSKISSIILTLVVIILIAQIIYGGYLIYKYISRKFKDATIEIGTESIAVKDFLIDEMFEENSKFVTDISQIDLTKVGEHEIQLSYNDEVETVTLNLIDTTPPVVKFQDISKDIDYKINPEDFVLEKSDLSQMTVEIESMPEITEYITYTVNVRVKDEYGNVTEQECKLKIEWIKENYTLELGQKLNKQDLLSNLEKDEAFLNQAELDKINASGVGEYTIKSIRNNIEYTTVVKVQDTTAPTLELVPVSIYDDQKTIDKSKFIKIAQDASGEVTTTLMTQIDFSKIGAQDIVINAKDIYGNAVEKATTLTIMKDTVGPVFSGLGALIVNKRANINYQSGVKATDAKDGAVTFTVDSSAVNTGAAGTYYATYTASDKAGNKSSAKRKIIVNHDQVDTNNKFDQYYNQYLAGKSVAQIVQTIKTNIGYNSSWGDGDPVWYGLTNHTGNCSVHASLVKKALDKKGVSSMIIKTTDGTHYWNLVNEGGKYRHYDATPGGHILGPATDAEKLASSAMHGRTWDTSAYPKAE